MMYGVRSLLFVPANRPERFCKAQKSGADGVCLDLEDAVAPADKDAARQIAVSVLPRLLEHQTPVGVRINAVGSAGWQQDLAAVGALVNFVLVPKAHSAKELATVAASVSGQTAIWPMVETAEGLRNCWDVAAAAQVRGVLAKGSSPCALSGATRTTPQCAAFAAAC